MNMASIISGRIHCSPVFKWRIKTEKISTLIYGHFVEHLGRVGPAEKRPQLVNYVWGGLESNRFVTDEFIEYCRAAGAEPYITISLGNGMLDKALHWLEYPNLDTSTKYANMRKESGHRVKYWGVGNEVYGEWQVGHWSGGEYAEKLRQYAQFMKGLDPFIKVIAVGADDPEWDLRVLKRAGKLNDFVSIHQHHGPDDYYETVAAAYYVERRLRLLESLIKTVGPDHIKITLDEWNVWYRVDPAEEMKQRGAAFLEEPYVLKDALFAAGVFLVLHRMCDIVQMANLAQMVNVLGMIKANPKGTVFTSIYHVFDLFANYTGRTRLGLEITMDHYSVKAKSFLKGSFSFGVENVLYLDGSATYDAARNMLCLAFLVNYHNNKLAEVEIDLSDLKVSGNSSLFELTAPEPFIGNDFEDPNRVHVVQSRWTLEASHLVLPLSSLSVLEASFKRDPLNGGER